MDHGGGQIALFLFTKSIINDLPINVFNNGNMIRDFTYVDDIVTAVEQLLFKPPLSSADGKHSTPIISSILVIPHRFFARLHLPIRTLFR